jgi:hypothetical protein
MVDTVLFLLIVRVLTYTLNTHVWKDTGTNNDLHVTNSCPVSRADLACEDDWRVCMYALLYMSASYMVCVHWQIGVEGKKMGILRQNMKFMWDVLLLVAVYIVCGWAQECCGTCLFSLLYFLYRGLGWLGDKPVSMAGLNQACQPNIQGLWRGWWQPF